MRDFRLPAHVQAFVLVLLMALMVQPVAAQNNKPAAGVRPDISYTVSMPRPYTHMLEVEMRVGRAGSGSVDLLMPVWTPGSYLVREFARHVQDFTAKDASGRELIWNKVNKNTWRIQTGGARDFKVSYSVYANELSVRTNELNDQHAFWNNAALLMYPNGQLSAPSTVRVLPPNGWKIATGLPEAPNQKNTFSAENFDILYDSPFEVSNFKVLSFEVKGIPHRIVIDGEGNYDPERMRRDVQKIVETEAALMGEIPYKDYTFILHLRSTGGGGLEHLNSTALGYPRFAFRPEQGYKGFLGLVAHEFFHLWNVKRIRPDALGPFDYTGENYTKLLWVAEGGTDYYANLVLRRAGLVTDKEYLAQLARSFQGLQNTPGRLEMSAEEASFDAWIKYYRTDENSVNSQISYYDKGAILCGLLDLEIRRRSRGAKSLDDVLRYLYTDFYKKGRNYTPEDFQRVAEQMAGGSLEQFFARYVRGREELDYNAPLEGVGLRLDTGRSTDAATARKAYLGADLGQEGERLTVRRVYAGGPAYDQGLNANDQVVALDNMRVNNEGFNARLAEKRPGDIIHLTLFRSDDLRTLDIKLGERTDGDYRILPVAQATPDQMRLYQDWLGTPYSTKQ
ncbi:MAG TPA: PDZ domain-containing protein [Pyrinomonadaceae bacterium]|nr:PDZ domain-containing protein [Pyrinomonadaceae bacterium]